MLQRAVIVLPALLCSMAAHAAPVMRPVISGMVFEDRLALAHRLHFAPAAGVTVKLYRDGGDRLPTEDDRLVATARTNESGVYVLRPEGTGDYWVTVDSRTFGDGHGWAEQTFGPAGSLCAGPDGTSRALGFEGSCFGGRLAARSDDASRLDCAEHLALVKSGEPVTGADFAFSFDVVTTVADGESVQGSLRQFLKNAAAIGGPNRMRFVPLEAAPEQRETTYGVPPRWWKATFAAPLPEITDADTLVDGTAHSFVSAGSVVDAHPGRLGERATFREGERRSQKIEKPDLELVVTGEQGLLCTAPCGVRAVAMHGAPIGIVARNDIALEDVLVGASPDGEPAAARGRIGVLLERGTAQARHLLVTGQSEIGIRVGPEARLDAERIDVSACGEPNAGGGILLLSDGSSIRGSSITANPGAAVIVGALDGSAPANGNSIDRSTLASSQSGVVFAPGSSRNALTHSEIIWNRFGGVTSAIREGSPAPKENRISANRFDENGLRPVVLELDVENPNQLIAPAETCERDWDRSNGGISTPRVHSARVIRDEKGARVIVRGKGCAGEIVEIYQSFVTSGVREESADVPNVRKTDDEEAQRETLTNEERTRSLPSIGEFNYLGATHTAADGTFEATFPLLVSVEMEKEADAVDEETDIWVNQVLEAADAEERAFSAIAIDSAGNTSEMSVRRGVD